MAPLALAAVAVLVLWVLPSPCPIALMVGVVASSRASDARTAQQFGVVVVLPIVGLFVAQLGGQPLHTGWILAAAAFLWALTGLLGWIGVRLFDREHILTKWT